MPLQATSGAASQDAYGGNGVAVVPTYIEDVFSTYLYTGDGTTQTITNGIDLSGKGGLVWIKRRNGASDLDHFLSDTNRGADSELSTNTTNAASNQGIFGSFLSTGFSALSGNSAYSWASWTFRKQPKFFDVQTWTGSGANRTISHSLGSVPACIIVKRTDTTGDWQVYHRSLANTQYLVLNTSAVVATGTDRWNSTTPTSTVFSLGNNADVNASGGTYIAYLFAHDAGGFGLTGTDNVISCGSFTTDGSGNATINLGYEAQFVIIKSTAIAGQWWIADAMRGFSNSSTTLLQAQSSSADYNDGNVYMTPTATGFTASNWAASNLFIYIAIRRGPMKVPTTGTSVFKPLIIPINSASATVPINAGLTTDLVIGAHSSDESGGKYFASRLTADYRLNSTSTAAEALGAYYWDNMVGVYQQETNAQPTWYFCRRAPSFFDEVCYTGTGVLGRTIAHNLTTVPELIIIKDRGNIENWAVYSAPVGNTKELYFNRDNAPTTSNNGYWNSTTPTSTVFSVGSSGVANNDSGVNYVAYLFATCAGVSKVGSYTGTGATQTINCGFSASGSRFVLIKRTDSTGDWYVWDSARGMVSGTDPSLLLNSTAAEVNANSVYAISTGFQIVSTAAGINASGGSYIFLSVA